MLSKLTIASLILSLTASGCMTLNRSAGSGYKDAPKGYAHDSRSAGPDTKKYAYELGYDPSQELTEEQMYEINKRRTLRELEKHLSTQKEKEQYSKALPWLMDDNEKVQLLSIPSVEGRQSWLLKNQVWSRAQKPNPQFTTLIESQDIAVGMPQDLVRKAWGEPQAVEVSGNPLYKNERWKYTKYNSTSEGFRQEKRWVYFEGGKVVGWETE